MLKSGVLLCSTNNLLVPQQWNDQFYVRVTTKSSEDGLSNFLLHF